jgi:hypothetical protein
LSLDIAVSFGGKSLFLLSDCPTVQNQRLRRYQLKFPEIRHFTGNNGDIRLVITKPVTVGLWFYELCAPLSSGGSFLLRTKLHQAEEISSIGVPVFFSGQNFKDHSHNGLMLSRFSWERVVEGIWDEVDRLKHKSKIQAFNSDLKSQSFCKSFKTQLSETRFKNPLDLILTLFDIENCAFLGFMPYPCRRYSYPLSNHRLS